MIFLAQARQLSLRRESSSILQDFTLPVRLNTKTLDDFCKSSGLKVNVDKSKYMCSRNVPTRRWTSFVNICSLRAMCNLGIYLGIPIFQGRVARSMLNPITEKIQRRMATWKSNILNKDDRQNMFLTLFLLTQCRLCGFLRSMTHNFLWGGDVWKHSLNLLKWDTFTKPKHHGGLGFRYPH
ncbi:hypothetical protein Lal_00035515 [Lupinus albus]|nr:hypothetical protein Lal_00035515 [Lupinus albus]